MSDDLKRMENLYVKTCEKGFEIQRLTAGIMIAVSTQEKSVEQGEMELRSLMEEKVELDEEANAIRINFQRSLKTEFPALHGKTNVGFRRSWKIVLTSHDGEVYPECGEVHEADDTEESEPPTQPEGPNFFGLTK